MGVYDEKALQELCNEVVFVAVADYKEAVKALQEGEGYTPKKTIVECREFFQSSRFSLFSDFDGNELLKLLDKKLGYSHKS